MKGRKEQLVLLSIVFLFIFSYPYNFIFAEENVEHVSVVPEGFSGIYSNSDLNKVREKPDGKYILMNDLDLSDDTSEGGVFYNKGDGWIPIGTESIPFSGILNGNGYKISGMKINIISNQTAYAGLIGYAVSAEIINLGLVNSKVYLDNQSVSSTTSTAYAGGIVGYGKDITISNSYNLNGRIQAFSLFNSYAGGLIAYVDASYNKNSTITNSYNTGDVDATTHAAGIAGEVRRTNLENTMNKGKINFVANKGKYVGGIIGFGTNSSILDGINTGDIQYADYGGGVAGYLTSSKIEFSNNSGKLTSNISFSKGGGLVGYLSSSSISDSYNSGRIISDAEYSIGGGITGRVFSSSSIFRTYNLGDVDVVSRAGGINGEQYNSIVIECYNSGQIDGSYAGGVNGYASGSTIKESFNIGTVLGYYSAGGISGNAKTTTIENSYNIGYINSTMTNKLGAIAGEFEGTLINNYYLDTKDKGVGFGSEIGTYKKKLEEMQSPTTYKDFNFDTTWTFAQNPKYIFPELKGLEIYGEAKPISISMKTLPKKLTYIQGDELDISGASITVLTNYDDTFDIDVTDSMVGPFYKEEARIQQIIITYDGITTSFAVTVEKDVTPPEKPIVREITDQSTNVQGEAESGSKIWIKDELSGRTIATGNVNIEGTFDIQIPLQKPGRLLLVTSVDKYFNWSEATEIYVKDITPPESPVVEKVTDQSTVIKGTTEGRATIYAKTTNNEWITFSDYDGSFSIDIPKLKGGTIISIWVSDSAGNESSKINVTVIDITAPSAPKVDKVTDIDTILRGNAEPNSTIIAKVSGVKIGEGKAGIDGNFSISIQKQKAGSLIEVYATDKAGNTSSPSSQNVVDQKPELIKLVGKTRYTTAVEISKMGWGKSDTVFLVNGWAIADGLTATPLAAAYDAPILLSRQNSIPEETMEEIKRLGAKKIVLIGGSGVISDSIQSNLQMKRYEVTRIGGKTRYDTSLLIAKMLDKIVDVHTVYIAFGYGEPDALSIAAQAGQSQQPIILTGKNNLPGNTYSWLKGEKIKTSYFIGGKGVISPAIMSEMNLITDKNVLANRISGVDRQETNGRVIGAFYKQESVSTILVAHSNTDKLVDALASGPLASKLKVPVLLVSNKGLGDLQVNSIKDMVAERIHQVGGQVPSVVLGHVIDLVNED